MLFFIIAALIVLFDRITKMWIASALEPGQVIELIPGIFRLTYYENTGAAFSILTDMRWLLVTVSSVAVVALIVVILFYRDGELGRLGAAFMLGGAVGNLVDRIATGSVVDMFEPEFINFAIFNVADIFITAGGLTFILHIILLSLKKRPDKTEKHKTARRVKRRGARRAPAVDPAFTDCEEMSFTEEQILEEFDIARQMESDDDASG